MNKYNIVLKKLICILLVVICFISLIPSISSAEIKGQFADDGEFDGESAVDSNVTNAAVTIISVIRIVAATIAIVMLLAIAMKYMTSAAGDRADIKKHAVAYVVGAFILFGAVGILGILNEIGGEIK